MEARKPEVRNKETQTRREDAFSICRSTFKPKMVAFSSGDRTAKILSEEKAISEPNIAKNTALDQIGAENTGRTNYKEIFKEIFTVLSKAREVS